MKSFGDRREEVVEEFENMVNAFIARRQHGEDGGESVAAGPAHRISVATTRMTGTGWGVSVVSAFTYLNHLCRSSDAPHPAMFKIGSNTTHGTHRLHTATMPAVRG